MKILKCNKCDYETFNMLERVDYTCPRCRKGKLEVLMEVKNEEKE